MLADTTVIFREMKAWFILVDRLADKNLLVFKIFNAKLAGFDFFDNIVSILLIGVGGIDKYHITVFKTTS